MLMKNQNLLKNKEFKEKKKLKLQNRRFVLKEWEFIMKTSLTIQKEGY